VTALGSTSQHSTSYVSAKEERIVVMRLACWGHHPIVNETHERCGRELNQRELAVAYRAAKFDQPSLRDNSWLWRDPTRQREAA
jgi:hypothetical protein